MGKAAGGGERYRKAEKEKKPRKLAYTTYSIYNKKRMKLVYAHLLKVHVSKSAKFYALFAANFLAHRINFSLSVYFLMCM